MSTETQNLLIATSNFGKFREMEDLLSGTRFRLLSLRDFPDIVEVEETGLTFAENALLKASGYAKQTGLIAFADDSGLEVDALAGRPGVLSARYEGMDANFAEKMEKLVVEIDKTGDSTRRARFVCSMAVADCGGDILFTSEGVCDGMIASIARGSGGFGYDPIFIPDGFDQTFGELPEAVKQRISHRYRAFVQIIPFLRHFEAN